MVPGGNIILLWGVTATHTQAYKTVFPYGLLHHPHSYLSLPSHSTGFQGLLKVTLKPKDSELRTTNKGEHVQFFLGLGYLTQCNIFQFHPFIYSVHGFSLYHIRVCNFSKRTLPGSWAVLSGDDKVFVFICGLIYEKAHKWLVLPPPGFVVFIAFDIRAIQPYFLFYSSLCGFSKDLREGFLLDWNLAPSTSIDLE